MEERERSIVLVDAVEAFGKIAELGQKYTFGGVFPAMSTWGHVQGVAQYHGVWIVSISRPNYDDGYLCMLGGHDDKFMDHVKTPSDYRLNHPGGMQVVGDFLFVSAERYKDRTAEGGRVLIYDLSQSEPGKLPKKPVNQFPVGADMNAGCVGVVDIVDPAEVPRLGTGHTPKRVHLVCVLDNARMRFFVSDGKPLGTASFKPLASQAAPNKDTEQIALCTDAHGVFLISIESPTDTSDYASLWRVPIKHGKIAPLEPAAARRHFVTRHGPSGPGAGVHFRFGGGARVSTVTSLDLLAAQNLMTSPYAVNTFPGLAPTATNPSGGTAGGGSPGGGGRDTGSGGRRKPPIVREP